VNGASGASDIDGTAARIAESEWGDERINSLPNAAIACAKLKRRHIRLSPFQISAFQRFSFQEFLLGFILDMGFRFRRSFKVVPGIRINLGKRGVSVSAGVRGAHVTLGPTGTRTTVGIPGTGISYTKHVGHERMRSGSRRAVPIFAVVLILTALGIISLDAVNGNSAPLLPIILTAVVVAVVISAIIKDFAINLLILHQKLNSLHQQRSRSQHSVSGF
jgi:hypothetical protein